MSREVIIIFLLQLSSSLYYFYVIFQVFVKLEELHIVTARKPLIHQNQPFAQYLHKIQPGML